jgi:hypothetical protein
MTIDLNAVIQNCKSLSAGHRVGNPQIGYAVPGALYDKCLRTCRIMLGIPPGALTAKDAYEALPASDIFQHLPPPPGFPCFFRTPNAAWHVTIADIRPWYVWSTDIKRHGQFDLVLKDVIQRAWDADWLGYATMLNGVAIP